MSEAIKRTTLRVLNERVGGMSKPGKMPGTSYSISAKRCNVGQKLRNIKGSVCEKCYALKGRYTFPQTQNALERRFSAMSDSLTWALDMAEIIIRKSKGYHRWFDSGDLQGVESLEQIIDVARRTPNVQHWLPTKEYSLIHNYKGEIPDNLCIRVSAPKKDTQIKGFSHTSSVWSKGKESPKEIFDCGAYTRGGKCGPCRACWDKDVPEVAYPAH